MFEKNLHFSFSKGTTSISLFMEQIGHFYNMEKFQNAIIKMSY